MSRRIWLDPPTGAGRRTARYITIEPRELRDDPQARPWLRPTPDA
ncbi:hypothetical protein [Blastococcus sp. TF02A_35]|nr:hypothetical protein [Blastococcus sp. TF02A_35]